MSSIDLFVVPLLLVIIYTAAYYIKNRYIRYPENKYFIGALTAKLVGAIAIGLIYDLYYGGGDTYNFFHDVQQLYKLSFEQPSIAFKTIFTGFDEDHPYLLMRMLWYEGDKSSFFVIRLGALFSFLTFGSYGGISLLFSVISFACSWYAYRLLIEIYPNKFFPLLIAIFYIPSVVIWGSGFFKDTLTLSAVFLIFASIHQIFFNKRAVKTNIFWFLIGCIVLVKVKVYIILCLLPSIIFWIVITYRKTIKNQVVRLSITPILLISTVVMGYFVLKQIGETTERYNLESVFQTAEATARWLSYRGNQQGGAVYTLGDYDYSPAGMLRKFIPAVNVTLFRPYIWEVSNSFMLLSAIESLAYFLATLGAVWRRGFKNTIRLIGSNPFLLFCLVFTIAFGFAIGLSTYNFGSLVRYKIPILPFFCIALIIIGDYGKRLSPHQMK